MYSHCWFLPSGSSSSSPIHWNIPQLCLPLRSLPHSFPPPPDNISVLSWSLYFSFPLHLSSLKYGFWVYHIPKMTLTRVTRGLLMSNIMTSSYHDFRVDQFFPTWNHFFGLCTTSLPGFLIWLILPLKERQNLSPYLASYPVVNHQMTWMGGKSCVWVEEWEECEQVDGWHSVIRHERE